MYSDALFTKWMVDAAPSLDWEVANIFVHVKPRSKQRARENWRTPEATLEWENLVRECARDQMRGRPIINFPVAARYVIAFSRTPGDTDNIEKIIWDALQRAVMTNDSLVRGYVQKAERRAVRGSEFVWVKFYARSQEDCSNYIAQCIEVPDAGY